MSYFQPTQKIGTYVGLQKSNYTQENESQPAEETALTLPNVDVKGDNLKNSLLVGGGLLLLWWWLRKRKKRRGTK
jgi:hypothetical protein